MTKVFPYDFDKSIKSFNVRLVPNLIGDSKMGDSIVSAIKEVSVGSKLQYHTIGKYRKSHIYLSYAIINPFDGFNSYLKDSVSIIRYGKGTHDKITGLFQKLINPFDLNNDISFIYTYKENPNFSYFEVDDIINSNQNKIYDETHPGKNDKEKIIQFLGNKDKYIEDLALQLSDEKFKDEIIKSYGSIIRDHKINKVLS